MVSSIICLDSTSTNACTIFNWALGASLDVSDLFDMSDSSLSGSSLSANSNLTGTV